MDSQKKQQLQYEVQQALLELLNNSDLIQVFQKYGVLASEAVEVEIKLDTHKLLSSDASEEMKNQNSLIASENQKLSIKFEAQKTSIEVTELQNFSIELKPTQTLQWCSKFAHPCPNGVNPIGCWIAVQC